MRSTKILAALLIAAMFASCAKDEFTQENVIQNGEYVGAELLGSNISVDFGNGSDTKAVGNTWESTDTVALAWLLSGSTTVGAPQTTAAPTTGNLYSNHMFEKSAEGNFFTTKGNIYKGWHFAYYPFAYAEQIGLEKTVVVNPTQTLVGAEMITNDLFYISARKFLSKENLDENMQLKDQFALVKAFHPIGITVNPTSFFTEDPAFNTLPISKITLNAGQAVFAHEVKLAPQNLPDFQPVSQYDKSYSEKNTVKEVKKSLSTVLSVNTWNNSLSTVVDNKDINLGGEQFLRMFVVPKTETLTNTNISFVVEVVGGVFTIAYTSDEDLEDLSGDALTAAIANNKAIDAIVKAYKANGNLSSHEVDTRSLQISLVLDKSDFSANYGGISNIDEWNKAVAVANSMNAVPTFVVDGDIRVTNDKVLAIPEKTYKKVGSTEYFWTIESTSTGRICVETDYEMPAELADAISEAATAKKTPVVVYENVTMTLDEEVTVETNVTNRGIINMKQYAKIDEVDNTSGRINVVYGSYLKAASGKAGIVAYNVTGEDSAIKMNQLMNPNGTGSQSEWVSINTIVVPEGKSFNLSMIDSSVDSDAYGQGAAAAVILNEALLRNITIEMNGGSLINDKLPVNLSSSLLKGGIYYGIVKDVKILSGSNTLTNIHILNALTVSAGEVTINATANSTGLIKDVQINEIVNHASLKANTDIYTDKITTARSANTLVDPASTIWYYTKNNQSGNVNGNVEKSEYSVSVDSPKAVKAAQQSAFVAALGTAGVEYIKLTGDITLTGTNRGMTLSDVTIDGNGRTISASYYTNSKPSGLTSAVVTLGDNATVKNVNFASPTSQYDVNITGSNVTIEGCTFATSTDENLLNSNKVNPVKRSLVIPATATNVTVKDCTFDNGGYAFNSNATDAAVITFENCVLNGWMSGHGVMTFENCSFGISGDYQNFVPYTKANFNACSFDQNFAISLSKVTANPSIVFDNANSVVGKGTLTHPTQLTWDLSGSGAYVTGDKKVQINGTDFTATVNTTTEAITW